MIAGYIFHDVSSSTFVKISLCNKTFALTRCNFPAFFDPFFSNACDADSGFFFPRLEMADFISPHFCFMFLPNNDPTKHFTKNLEPQNPRLNFSHFFFFFFFNKQFFDRQISLEAPLPTSPFRSLDPQNRWIHELYVGAALHNGQCFTLVKCVPFSCPFLEKKI